MITIIIVVYHSDKEKLQTILKKLGAKYKIIIVDNSTNYSFKDIKLTKKTKIIRSRNIGNGGGINLGLNKVNTKFAIYFDIDTIFICIGTPNSCLRLKRLASGTFCCCNNLVFSCLYNSPC